MSNAALKVLSILLILCVLSIGGLAQAQAAEHAGHHAHHQAAEHGTVLCSWMCAAGGGWETVVASPSIDLTLIEHLEFTAIVLTPVSHVESSASRGPPRR